MSLSVEQVQSLPWNIRRALEQICNHAQKYLVDVAHFIKTHTLKTGKILSFHLLDVACISKGTVDSLFVTATRSTSSGQAVSCVDLW